MDLKAFDKHHIWHPYTNVQKPGPTFLVKEAEGVYLTLDDGTKLIDAMSSWWCMLHGHKNPEICAAMHAQIDQLPHVMFGGLTHEPAIELAQTLVAMTPENLNRVFYCDSGSVAVEVAMKMAVQYQFAKGERGRSEFATIRSGYHGDTWKAMSVCDPDTGMHHLFQGAVTVQHFVERPPIAFGEVWNDDPSQNGLGALNKMLSEKGGRIAALILEPVVQGAGGMYFYHPQYLNEAKKLCEQHGVLLIFDEIATGFARLGKMFATDFCDIAPDIMCLGKAMTGGHISFAATMASDDVACAIGDNAPGAFMHGPTFMGNPIGCAAALASLKILQRGEWQQQVPKTEAQLKSELEPAKDLPNVADVRVLGAIGVIEMKHNVSADVAHGYAKEHGVYLRPFAKNVYTMPPFITSAEELTRITSAMLNLAKVL
jgi:adenosylmethionine-8-amino-7-oxononanoate aminotransferase